MSAEEIKAALDKHCISGTSMPPQGAGQTLPELMILCFSCGWMRASEYHAHVAEVIAALLPEASERVEYGIRTRPEWRPLLVTWEADEASAHADAGVPVFRRTRTTYRDTVTDWTEVAE